VHYLTEEAYEIIRNIRDPEFPQTLEELDVVDPSDLFLTVNEERKRVEVKVIWTPTTPSCGLAMNIALCIHAKLRRDFSQREWLKVEVKVAEGRHDKGAEIDKQVNDKERVAAALENDVVMQVIETLIKEPDEH
jgi:metal-sulfur cluster biosynthetic enzyme